MLGWRLAVATGRSGALTAKIESRRLDDERAALRAEAATDALTGVRNRRAFEAEVTRLAGQLATLLTIDLDNFKLVNDRFGHQVGDEVLRRSAEALCSAARSTLLVHDGNTSESFVARVGGDEFVIISRSDNEMEGRRLAARVSAAMAEVDWSDLLGRGVQRVSIGLACGVCGPDLIAASDREMYDAKTRPESRTSG